MLPVPARFQRPFQHWLFLLAPIDSFILQGIPGLHIRRLTQYRHGAGDDFPGHVQDAVGPGLHRPFDQGHLTALDFDTGDAAGWTQLPVL